MSRRVFLGASARLAASAAGLAVLSGGCVLVPFRASAKVPRIGYLCPGPRESSADRVDAFLAGLNDLGYVEGQTIAIEWRFTPQGSDNQFETMAAELTRMPVDLIVVESSSAASQAAKQATRTIPIVASNVVYPVESGLVASLARPGGNLTALASTVPGLPGKELDLLRNIVPGLTRVAFLADATNLSSAPAWEDFYAAAPAAGVQLLRVDLRSPAEMEAVFRTPEMRAADAVWVGATALLLPVRLRLTELALQHHLPSGVRIRQFADSGLLMSYGPSLAANSRQAATVVDKILKGAKPSELPVEQPREFEFVVNLKTAQALGVTIPPDVAAQVTEWIQ